MSDRPPHRLPASDVRSGWPQQRPEPIPNSAAEDEWQYTTETLAPGYKPCPTCRMSGVVKDDADATRNRAATPCDCWGMTPWGTWERKTSGPCVHGIKT